MSPSISIDQKSAGNNPRSTVATITEIYDYLRVLFARVGVKHCLQCGRAVGAQTTEAIIERIVNLPEQTRILVLAPIVSGRKGEYREDLADALKAGFVRARIDGKVYDLMEEIQLDRNQRHDIEIVIDRIVIKPEIRSRVAETVETALRLGEGRLIVNIVEGQPNAGDLLYSKDYTCVHCNISYEPPAPRQFSFNSPAGMCPSCKGLGTKTEISPNLVVPDVSKSIGEGAVVFWGELDTLNTKHIALGLASHYGFSLDTPWNELTDSQQQIILYGTGGEEIPFVYRTRRRRRYRYEMPFEGVIPLEERKYFQTNSEMHKRYLSKFMVSSVCPECEGKRLKLEVKSVTIAEKSIFDVIEMTVGDCREFFEKLQLSEREAFIATDLLKEIKGRLWFLMNVGLHYLTLNRTAPTLSGGESQRIRLASQIGAGLRGVLYVLDEPSIGLHPRDNAHLLATLKHLRDMGNTVIVVEHDADTMWAADMIVDFGPGPGIQGGEIAGIGPPREVAEHAASLTAKYLRGEQQIEIPANRRDVDGNWLEIYGAHHHNLKHINVRIPIGAFTCVTGVSGSGKSSLITDILYKALARDLMKAHEQPGEYEEIRALVFDEAQGEDGTVEEDEERHQETARQEEGGSRNETLCTTQYEIRNVQSVIDKIIDIDQAPIGRTPRSNPATYTKVFDHIRALYAQMTESNLRGYKQGRFSFNVKGGRCEACQGNGSRRIEMHFLADVWVKCNVCRGKRYNDETLQVEYRGKNIAEVLKMDVQEALEHFSNVPTIAKILQTLHDVGLDYIKLGQPAPTLSGGEAQRIKLARELAKRSTGKTLYILDEPTTGLHFDDVRKLLEVLHRLVDAGNTIVVIEHNLEVVKTADYLIDLGPEGGEEGGYVVAVGTPEAVSDVDMSYTGRALKPVLDRESKEDGNHLIAQYANPPTYPSPSQIHESEEIYLAESAVKPDSLRYISVRGAREHNLKNVDVEIPHRKLTTFTGVSGFRKVVVGAGYNLRRGTASIR